MKYLMQVLIILGFTAMGEVLAYLIPFPIPAAIYGIVLMLIALGTTVHVKEASDFLISIMPILYVPACVRILEYWGVISQNITAIVTITVISTFLVFAVSALVTQRLLKKKGGKCHG